MRSNPDNRTYLERSGAIATKNYTTTISVGRTVGEIQDLLAVTWRHLGQQQERQAAAPARHVTHLANLAPVVRVEAIGKEELGQ